MKKAALLIFGVFGIVFLFEVSKNKNEMTTASSQPPSTPTDLHQKNALKSIEELNKIEKQNRLLASIPNPGDLVASKSIVDYFTQNLPQDIKSRASVLLDEQNQWRILAKLAIDGVRVENSDLTLEPTDKDKFNLRSGSLPELPEKFPSFPNVDTNETVMNVRNSFEKKGRHVQSIDFLDKSWIVHSDLNVTACVNVDIQYEARTSFEHEIICINAQSGETTASRSVVKKF